MPTKTSKPMVNAPTESNRCGSSEGHTRRIDKEGSFLPHLFKALWNGKRSSRLGIHPTKVFTGVYSSHWQRLPAITISFKLSRSKGPCKNRFRTMTQHCIYFMDIPQVAAFDPQSYKATLKNQYSLMHLQQL